MLVLGIETSCDETSAAVVENGRRIFSNVVSSQVKIHSKYSGVVPELASRAHVEKINTVLENALKKTDIGLISYVYGPGLAGPLLVGQIAAQTLSFLLNKPLIGINHIEGHLYSALLENPGLEPPFLALIASGGHTDLIRVENFGRYAYLGGTRDDAAGEAFDKVAKLLGLGYPGGPVIDSLAKKGDPGAVKFPRPYLRGTWDFSFSGLKTSVLNYLKAKPKNRPVNKEDICASFQQAVIETLAEKTFAAAGTFKVKKIVLGGGVSANSSLRRLMKRRGLAEKVRVYIPSTSLCTDNAAMVACAGYYKSQVVKPGWCAEKIDPGLVIRNWV
jgi:N6-L-threonylcarbamoyladenine synthase